MKVGCHYCDIVSQGRDRHDLLWEDHRLAAFLHEDWSVKGHSVVVWKRHVENLSGLADYDAAHLMNCFAAIERAVLQATGQSRSIVMKLGLAVSHLHLHIYPFSDTATRAEVFAAFNNESHHATSEKETAELIAAICQGLASRGGSR